jgi:hypothetical protein
LGGGGGGGGLDTVGITEGIPLDGDGVIKHYRRTLRFIFRVCVLHPLLLFTTEGGHTEMSSVWGLGLTNSALVNER